MKEGNIEVLIDLLKQHKEENKGKSAIILLGAGASISAGIPSANGIIDEIKNNPAYTNRVKGVKEGTYSEYMRVLTQAHRKELFKKHNEKAKINAAHLYAAQIFNAGFADCIITTNFDNLFLRAYNLFNHIPPPTYDLSVIKEVVTDDIDLPGVVYLHGQTHGIWQLNNADELDTVSPAVDRIINKLSANRTWIVVGYSGNDPVFDKLAKISSYSDELYWIGYKEDKPIDKVCDFLCNPLNSCYYISGYDADSFFNELRLGLELKELSFVHKPFTHLSKLYDEVLPIVKDGQTIDLCSTAKKWMDDLIPAFEERKEYNVPSINEIKSDILLEKIKNIFNNEEYVQLAEIENEILSTNNEAAKKYLYWCYNNYGVDLIDKYGDKEGAKENYEKALSINPENAKAHNNYANLLIEHFGDKDGAKVHYMKSVATNPVYADAHYNLANLLIDHFGDKDGAKKHFEKAVAINTEDAEAHYNYAVLLKKEFNELEKAKEHYLKAVKLKPEFKTPERDNFFGI